MIQKNGTQGSFKLKSVKNPSDVEKGVKTLTVDDKAVDGNVIPFEDGKKEYNVEVIMG